MMNVGDLAGPAAALVDRISETIGGLCPPWQMRRPAKPHVEARVGRSDGESKIADLQTRAMQRLAFEEARKQRNMESVLARSLPHLEESADPDGMDEDWITNFFEHARAVSDKEMQGLWARILAGEANKPGSISRRTVNLIQDLDKEDAQTFFNLCKYVCRFDVDDSTCPLIFSQTDEIYNRSGVNFPSLNHLETLGLVSYDFSTGYSISLAERTREIQLYHGRHRITIPVADPPNARRPEISVGYALFTTAGLELYSITSAPPEGKEFVDYLVMNKLPVGARKE